MKILACVFSEMFNPHYFIPCIAIVLFLLFAVLGFDKMLKDRHGHQD